MSNISIKEEGKFYAKSKYFSGSQILNHDYQDKLIPILIIRRTNRRHCRVV
ncbi:MAG: hypothetical protein O7157_03325 [Wolbachia endosymbiont of Tetragnatha montana]|nr:hypothetical protein [Wolbachia endosymbiont of Tetragnatha montana]